MEHLATEHIWTKRWNQDIEGTIFDLAKVQTENNWESLKPIKLSDFTSCETRFQEYLDCLLLKSSLLRAEGEFKKSSILIAKTHNEYNKTNDKMSFRLLYELGLDHWCHDDVSSALDCFSLAEKLAKTHEEKLFSLTNLVFCLEFLDLERTKIEKEIKKYHTLVDESVCLHFFQQIKAYQLRKSFYHSGEINEFNPSENIGQAEFFACFVSHLPYINNDTNYKNLLIEKNYLWQGSYRLRTLNNLFLPSDLKSVRIADAIDRLYLWVWQWMTGYEEVSLKKIELTLASIVEELDIELLSKENQLLLRNSLSWLSLACPKLISGMKKSIDVLESLTSKNYDFLDQEFFLIQKIKMTLYCSKLPKIKLSEPFTRYHEDLELLPRLFEVIKPLLDNKSKKKEYELIIDFTTNEVRNIKLEKTETSPLLSRFFFLAFEKGQFKLSDIKKDFGKNGRQAYNLFNRAKKFLPAISIDLEKNVIKTSFKRDRISLLNTEHAVVLSDKKIKHTHYKTSASESIISIQAIRLVYPDGFKRKEFEKTFELSKTTATRIINNWIEDNIIEKKGNGKVVVYKWIK
jgi:hypothetical protein